MLSQHRKRLEGRKVIQSSRYQIYVAGTVKRLRRGYERGYTSSHMGRGTYNYVKDVERALGYLEIYVDVDPAAQENIGKVLMHKVTFTGLV